MIVTLFLLLNSTFLLVVKGVSKKKISPWHGIKIELFASRAIARPLFYGDIGSRSGLILIFTGFILDRGFAGFPQFEKMPHKIYVGVSNEAHKIVPKNKY